MEWRPIETAPKAEWEEVLVWSGLNAHVACWMEGLGWFNGDVTVEPTHWMPLPSPPLPE